MYIRDCIYGESEVDGVLERLINSAPVQRLKGVHQAGAAYLVEETWDVSRFEHSIGVMLLIRKLGGSVEEQIAGLLHDVSHTAFSHVVDTVFDNRAEDYHEQIFDSVVRHSEIPDILETYGYRCEDFLDDSRWTLLERPSPELCADRVDYTLRDMYRYGKITKEEVEMFLEELVVVDGSMYVSSVAAGEWFVETYYKEVIDFFLDPLNIYSYDRLAEVLKLAMGEGILTTDDFLLEDESVIRKIKKAGDSKILQMLATLHSNVEVVIDEEDYHIHRVNKIRLIDPSVWKGAKLTPVSELSFNVRQRNEDAEKRARRGTFVRVLSA
ncbi:HD domain-containing protein [Halobacillus sp. BAB-2008]|uniref:HD domain-containing protein n=1 Tax=Halobacillus sp. BAB-2008 TaxID=1246484 RepID=UPI0002A4E736|nr:HD domain-containing protein [Halobacillus sp. BAB-2008]ELK44845.1 metal-dependent phosphohydrolase [Halobacillus sp. BAB-2008]